VNAIRENRKPTQDKTETRGRSSNPIWFYFLLFAFFVPLLFASAQPRDLKNRMDTYLTKLERAGTFSGAVLVAIGDRVVWQSGYGLADRQTRIPFTSQTAHHVASISKMITAATVLKLRDQQKLNLEDRICTHLETCPQAWRAITIKHLMRHTSGIRDYEEPLGLYSQAYLNFMTQPGATQRILEQARTQTLGFVPGTQFAYSNTGYVVLSSLIEQVAERPFNDAVRALVLEPAGLTHSSLEATAANPVSVGYTNAWKRIPSLSLEPPAGDAALISTLEDLFKWSLALDGPGRSEVFTPGLGGYGYGWFIDSRFGRKRYVHTGELPGYRTVFVKFPKEHLTMILFANQDQAPMETITRDLTRMILKP
jgi:CubicO group peptidase (beta-lactamase class C family)